MVRALFPEIESTTIGTQTWPTRNFEAVCTPMGNVISKMQEASAVEKVVNGDFASSTGWILISSTISGGKFNISTAATTD